MKQFFAVIGALSFLLVFGQFVHTMGYEEGWQDRIDWKPPNPPPTRCVIKNPDGSKCLIRRKRT